MPRITALTSLIKLKLETVAMKHTLDLTPLCKLKLLELCIKNCPGVAEALILPGAFPALQKLRLDDSLAAMLWGNEDQQERLVRAERLRKLRNAVFKLPCLSELSGRGSIFSLNIPETWWKCLIPCSPSSCSLFTGVDGQHVWRKKI